MTGRVLRTAGMAAVALYAGVWHAAADAQNYPTKPVRIYIGYGPGGAADFAARAVGQKFPELLGQPLIVESRPGAGSTIAIERVATSPPDGYSLLLIADGGAVQSALRPSLSYDLERDLAPVSSLASGAFVLAVHPSVPARDVRELIALARVQSGKLNFGSSGTGGAAHLAGELFNLMAKVSIVHVPYKGGAEAAVANASGQIDLSYPSIPAALPLVQAGKIRALAVTRAKRTSFLPDVPTLHESGLTGYDYYIWYGVLAPAGVPKDIIARLNTVIGKIMNTAEMKELFKRQGLEPQTDSPEQFAAFIHHELVQYRKLIKAAGIKAE